MTVLGVEIDTPTMTARLPKDKIAAYLHHINIATHAPQSIKSLQSLAGKLAWAGRVIPVGRRLTKALHNEIGLFPHSPALNTCPITLGPP